MTAQGPGKEAGEHHHEMGWTVFTEQARVFDAPSFDAKELAQLKTGMMISGEIYLHPDTGEPWLTFERDGAKAYVTLTALIRLHPNNLAPGDLPIGREVATRWWGMPLDYVPSDLRPIPEKYFIPDNKEYLLRTEALQALMEMLDAAERDGIIIRVISSYRSGERQKGLYINAVKNDGAAQKYSAPPGHSEHQLGTTVDLVDPEQKELFTQEFGDTPQGKWLARNAGRYGFVQSYTKENQAETGYIPEPWHWRYVGR